MGGAHGGDCYGEGGRLRKEERTRTRQFELMIRVSVPWFQFSILFRDILFRNRRSWTFFIDVKLNVNVCKTLTDFLGKQ